MSYHRLPAHWLQPLALPLYTGGKVIAVDLLPYWTPHLRSERALPDAKMLRMIDIDLDFDGLPLHCAPQLHLGHGHQGPAVIACVVDGGALWVHNGQYASKVRFCPYCGKPSSDFTVHYASQSSDAIDAPHAENDPEPSVAAAVLPA